MTLVEQVSMWSATGAVAVALGSVVYAQAQRNSTASRAARRVERLDDGEIAKARLEGAQEVKNRAAEQVARDVAQLAKDVTALGVSFENHEDYDERRFSEGQERFSRLEKLVQDGFHHLSAQINNVALGRTGKLFEVKSSDGS